MPASTLVRRLRAAGCALVTGAVIAVAVPSGAEATSWPGHRDRTLVRHVVAPGETASGLAVRFHAWTDELVALNHLSGGHLRRGQVLRIPVVVSAWRQAHPGARLPSARPAHQKAHHQHHRTHHRTHRARHHEALVIHSTTPPRGWRHADLSRTSVRRLVSAVAHHYGVPRRLALAIAWQESGWKQRRVSSAGAIGVMQVMPDTGRWMRWYAGRPLRLRDTHDNVRAGVLTLRVLRAWTRRDDNAIAAYYQGLGNVRHHGWFRDTHRYVASVRAIERHLKRTGEPS